MTAQLTRGVARIGTTTAAKTDDLADLLAVAGDWTWEANPGLALVRMDATAIETDGCVPRAMLGLELNQLVEERDAVQVRLRRRQRFRNLQVDWWDNGGKRLRRFSLSGRPVVDNQGKFQGYRGIAVENLVENQGDGTIGGERFRALFDHAAFGIAVVGDGGEIVEVNREMTAMFGWSTAEFSRLTLTDLIHPEDRKAASEEAGRLLSGSIGGYRREDRFWRKDESWFWGRLTGSLTAGQGEDLALMIIEDVDAHRRIETDLGLFRAVMEASHEAITILSPTGSILFVNSAYARLFGVSAQEAVGSHYQAYFPPESQAMLSMTVGQVLKRGESWEGVLEARDCLGRTFPLWQRAGAVRDADGNVKFYFAFMHDHTAQQLFEDELFNAKEAAEEANVTKTRFLAAASHDLRQPMQALSMFLAVLSARNRDADQGILIGRVQDSVTALEMLLNGLLDVSKLEAGLVVPQKQDFQVAPFMARLATEVEAHCEAKGLTLRMVSCDATVRSDPSLLERVLRNLLKNAVRYTETGRILFGCRRHGRMLRFEIWDTGIGIPPAEMKNIFREFHQVGNPSRDRRQGLGLGLAIVDRLSRLLEHPIHVASVEGKGSVFAIDVPLSDRAPAAKAEQLPLALKASGAVIVVIDDEPDVLEGVTLLLESWGHAVLAGSTAEEVIRMLPSLPREPDIIVADYRLKNGDTGGQAIARVEVHLRRSSRVPAIILTGDTAPERLRQAQALGHRLLHKPVRPEALCAAIDDALMRRTAIRKRPSRKKAEV